MIRFVTRFADTLLAGILLLSLLFCDPNPPLKSQSVVEACSFMNREMQCYARTYSASNVQIRHLQRVFLDEVAPRFDDVAHQG